MPLTNVWAELTNFVLLGMVYGCALKISGEGIV
jgi:hypothetical protein